MSLTELLFSAYKPPSAIREKAWVRFKDAAKHLARGAAGTPGVAVNETKSLTAKLRDANKELRDHMAGVEGTNT